MDIGGHRDSGRIMEIQLTEEIVLFVLPQPPFVAATFVAFALCRSDRSRLQWKAQRQAAHFRGGGGISHFPQAGTLQQNLATGGGNLTLSSSWHTTAKPCNLCTSCSFCNDNLVRGESPWSGLGAPPFKQAVFCSRVDRESLPQILLKVCLPNGYNAGLLTIPFIISWPIRGFDQKPSSTGRGSPKLRVLRVLALGMPAISGQKVPKHPTFVQGAFPYAPGFPADCCKT